MNSISLNYGDLENQVVQWLAENDNLHRVVCIDLETKVIKGTKFVSGERILAVSLAYLNGETIETQILVLEEDNDECELKLLKQLDDFLLSHRPLILIGFNLTGYDIPLLNMKLRKYWETKLWGITDATGRGYILDMKHPIRFELAKYNGSPKFMSLAQVIDHQRFATLPLMRAKATLTGENKGEEIFALWTQKSQKFKRYAEGDVKDVFLIFEDLFKLREKI
jgi:hypothetical protein